jgi:hypothetical protein
VNLASSFTVSGAHGVLILIAAILFAVAAVLAWVVEPRNVWASFVAAGAALVSFALLFS